MVTNTFEEKLLDKYDVVIGIDEVGRGCFAGPVSVGGFVYHRGMKIIDGVDDSKIVSKKNRIKLNSDLIKFPNFISMIPSKVIDSIGIAKAIEKGINECVEKLKENYDFIVLLDGRFSEEFNFECVTIIDGDAKHYSIAAASIITKVYRDNFMSEMALKYPLYGFEKHVGYGTKYHIEALRQHGPCEIHRFSYKPIKEIYKLYHQI